MANCGLTSDFVHLKLSFARQTPTEPLLPLAGRTRSDTEE